MKTLINKLQIVKVLISESGTPEFVKGTYRKSFLGFKYGKPIEYFYTEYNCLDNSSFYKCDTIQKAKALYQKALHHRWYIRHSYMKDSEGYEIIKTPYIRIDYSNNDCNYKYFTSNKEMYDFVNANFNHLTSLKHE